jgi:hypothetical protein
MTATNYRLIPSVTGITDKIIVIKTLQLRKRIIILINEFLWRYHHQHYNSGSVNSCYHCEYINHLNPSEPYMYSQVYCTTILRSAHTVYFVFCVDLRTNGDYFLIQR